MRDALIGESGGETFPVREVTSKPALNQPGTGIWKAYFMSDGFYVLDDTGRVYFLYGSRPVFWVTREGYLWVDDTGRPWDYGT